MFDVGAILGKLVLDASKWEASIEKAKADANSFEGAILRNEQAVKRFGIALGVVGTAVTALNLKLIQMAANVEESENLFEVSMGSMADNARAWSEEMSDSLGLNEFEIRRTVGTLNVMVKSMGIAEDAAYDISTNLVQLSQDMASFYNLRPEEAFDKVQSGLVGMSRPLQDLGILVNETTVKEWALTNGIVKQGQELSQQQKVLGRYMVMMEATTASQGDLARTMESTTNQGRILSSGIAELGAKLGTTLLPLTNSILTIANNIVRSLESIVETMPSLTSAFVIGTAVIGALLIPLGGLLVLLPGIAAAAVAMGTTVGAVLGGTALVLAGVAASAMGMVYAFQKWDLLKATVYAFAEGVNSALSNVVGSLSRFYEAASKIPIVGKMYKGVAEDLKSVSEGLAETADMMHRKVVDSLLEQQEKEAEFEFKIKSSLDGIKGKADGTWNSIEEAFKNAMNKMESRQQTWLQKVQQSFNVYEEIGKRSFNALSDSFSTYFFDVMSGEINSLTELFAEFGRHILQIVADIMAQWLAMKIITGVTSAFGSSAVAGVGGYGANTPAGVTNMGSYSSLPSFDTGIDSVPYDMVAKVHKGEQIVPASENASRSLHLTLHNLITPESVARAMASREGADTIVNIIALDIGKGGQVKKVIKSI